MDLGTCLKLVIPMTCPLSICDKLSQLREKRSYNDVVESVQRVQTQTSKKWCSAHVFYSSFSFPFARIDGSAIGLAGNRDVTADTLPETTL